jgi:hypothetical protein
MVCGLVPADEDAAFYKVYANREVTIVSNMKVKDKFELSQILGRYLLLLPAVYYILPFPRPRAHDDLATLLIFSFFFR